MIMMTLFLHKNSTSADYLQFLEHNFTFIALELKLAMVTTNNVGFAVKTARLKQAKDEAEREAAAYRASLEEDYRRKVSEVMC